MEQHFHCRKDTPRAFALCNDKSTNGNRSTPPVYSWQLISQGQTLYAFVFTRSPLELGLFYGVKYVTLIGSLLLTYATNGKQSGCIVGWCALWEEGLQHVDAER